MEDDEAALEAVAELRRMDEAEQYEPAPAAPPPVSRYTAPITPPLRAYMPRAPAAAPVYPPMGVAPAQPPEPAVVQAPPLWTPPSPKDLKTLEDLYAAFPAIGDGQTCLRVERTQPKMHQNQHVAGWLGDLHEQIPMEELAFRYGGQKYTISVLVPVRGRGSPMGEQSPMRRAAAVEVTIPGPPAMGSTPRVEEDPMAAGRISGLPGRQMPMGYGYGQEPPEVQLKRLDLEAQERERQAAEQRELRQQMGLATRSPEGAFDAVREQARQTVTMIEKNAEEKVQLLRSQNEALLLSTKEKEAELSAARVQILDLQRSLTDAKYHTETEAVRSLKERHESELRKNNEVHAQEMARLSEMHRGQIAEISQRNNDERQRLIEAETREKERIRGDARDRELALHADVERRERLAQATTDARVADIQRQMDTQLTLLRDTTQRELQSMKDAHNREMNAVRTAEEMKTALAKETSSIQVGSVQDRLLRAEADAARHRQEADELRSKVNKPFPEAMREAREVGMMIGLVEKGEGGAAVAEEDLDWKKVAANAVKDLIGQAGPTLKAVMDARAQNQQQQAQQQAQAQQQQAYAQQQQAAQEQYQQFGQAGPPQGQAQPVMAGRPPPRRRFAMAPPPAWAQAPGPPPPGTASYAPPPPMGPVGNPPGAAYIQAPPTSAVSMQGPMYSGMAEVPTNEDLRIAHSPLEGPAPTEAGARAAAEAAASRAERVQYDPAAPPVPYYAPPVEPTADVPFPEPPAATGGYVSRFSQPQPAPQRVHVTPPPQQQAQQVPELSPDQIASFIGQLGGAAKSEIPQEMFAQGFIDQAGPAVAADLLRRVSPEDLFQILAATPGGSESYISTPKGQTYVRGVWTEAKKKLGM